MSEKKLQVYIPRLVLGEVKIHLFREHDLVTSIEGKRNMSGALGGITGHVVHKDMTIEEILRVGALPPRETYRKSYEVGLKPIREIPLKDIYKIFEILTNNHPQSRDLLMHSYTEMITDEVLRSADTIKEEIEEVKKKEESSAVKTSSPTLLFLRDLSEMDEPVSVSRLIYFRPFAAELARKKENIRHRLIQDIIYERYPFSERDNKEWISQIRTAD